MNQQQAHVDDASEQPDDGEAFGISLYQMEIDRVKYLLASYLRMRLRKIEKFVFHILGSEEEFSKLSPNEVEFASKYQEAVERHLKESCLDQIPDKFRSLAADDAGNTSLACEFHLEHPFISLTKPSSIARHNLKGYIAAEAATLPLHGV